MRPLLRFLRITPLDSVSALARIAPFYRSRFARVREVAIGNFEVTNANSRPEKAQFMKSNRGGTKSELLLRKTMLLGLLAISPSFQRAEGAANVVVWDAGSRFADTIDAENSTGWKAVPTEFSAMAQK